MRHVLAALLSLPFLAAAAHAQSEQQQLVDRATLAAQEMLNDRDGTQAQSVLRNARAVMICPQVFRAGFLFGGQGGSCVLVARDGNGSWSYPAFYGLGGGSFGFQAGVEDAEVMLLIMSDGALHAILDSQFTLGASASGTFVDLGGGVQGATTSALRADVVGFSRARGLFAGIALGGSLLSAKSEWNQLYYGRPEATQQIVIEMHANNPAADPLREVLGRYGATRAAAPPLFSDRGAGPGIAAPPASAPIQQHSLAPPRR